LIEAQTSSSRTLSPPSSSRSSITAPFLLVAVALSLEQPHDVRTNLLSLLCPRLPLRCAGTARTPLTPQRSKHHHSVYPHVHMRPGRAFGVGPCFSAPGRQGFSKRQIGASERGSPRHRSPIGGLCSQCVLRLAPFAGGFHSRLKLRGVRCITFCFYFSSDRSMRVIGSATSA
jgi:hypothetical protein